MIVQYDLHRRLFVGDLNEIGSLCGEPKGALYTFPSIEVKYCGYDCISIYDSSVQ